MGGCSYQRCCCSARDSKALSLGPNSILSNGALTPIIMNTPGIMHEDKLIAILIEMKSSRPSYFHGLCCCHTTSRLCTFANGEQVMVAPLPDVRRSQIKEGLDAAASGLAPDLPTEIPGVGNLAFFKPNDAQHFSEISTDLARSNLICR